LRRSTPGGEGASLLAGGGASAGDPAGDRVDRHEGPVERGPGFVTASVVDRFGNVLGVMYNRHYLEVPEAIRSG